MNFQEYIEKTREIAVYPESYERDYVIHGLVDEAGEILSTIDENQLGYQRYSRRHIEDIVGEIGDATWYLARLFDHFDIEPGEERKYIYRKGYTTPPDPSTGRKEAVTLLKKAAEINGHQKKSVRDETDRTNQIFELAWSILYRLQKISYHFGVYKFETVLEENINKLFDRKRRNVLHGDGDHR